MFLGRLLTCHLLILEPFNCIWLFFFIFGVGLYVDLFVLVAEFTYLLFN